VCNSRERFVSFGPFQRKIGTADKGQPKFSSGSGSVKLKLENNQHILIEDCRFVEEGKNIISIPRQFLFPKAEQRFDKQTANFCAQL
jgi:hypothetical protein